MRSVWIATIWRALAIAIFAAPGHSSGADAVREPVSITIATGPVGGFYHPVGGAICQLVNANTAEHGISCTVEITRGSVANIRDLRDGVVDLAFAQSDWQHDAVKGIGPFEVAGPDDDLRAVFAPYVEHFTVVAGGDKDISTFEDLKGKRVFAGEPGSGRRHTLGVVLDAHGWTGDDLIEISEFKASNEAEALCDNEFDAFVHTVGNPNPTVREATHTCNAVLVTVAGPIVEKLVSDNAYYVESVIPAGTYLNQSKDVPGFGLVATLVTTATANPEAVYQVAKVFFENLETFRQASPAFSSLSPEAMTRTGLSAPLHDGAMKYFSEVGLR